MEEKDKDVSYVCLHPSFPWSDTFHHAVSPVVEAFGYERILFGSSPAGSSSSSPRSDAGDWYEIARESLAELGVEQSAVEAVFADNANRVYGKM